VSFATILLFRLAFCDSVVHVVGVPPEMYRDKAIDEALCKAASTAILCPCPGLFVFGGRSIGPAQRGRRGLTLRVPGCETMLTYTPAAKTIALALCAAGPAFAEPIGMLSRPYNSADQSKVQAFGGALPLPQPIDGGGGGGGGYDPRVNPTRGVNPFDRVTMSLLMYDIDLNFVPVNAGGEVSTLRGNAFTDGGANRNGTGRVRFQWDEVVISSTRTVIRAFISSTNNQPLVPASAVVPRAGGGTSPALYWTWHFGSIDPVNYMSNITRVTLRRASMSQSTDGGINYFTTTTTTSNIATANDWRPGVDNGSFMNTVGDGTNFVLLQYEVEYIPNAGTIALLGGGLASLTSRRRRR